MVTNLQRAFPVWIQQQLTSCLLYTHTHTHTWMFCLTTKNRWTNCHRPNWKYLEHPCQIWRKIRMVFRRFTFKPTHGQLSHRLFNLWTRKLICWTCELVNSPTCLLEKNWVNNCSKRDFFICCRRVEWSANCPVCNVSNPRGNQSATGLTSSWFVGELLSKRQE